MLTKLVIDCSTDTETVVPLTQEEVAAREEQAAAYEAKLTARLAAEQAKTEAKASAAAKLAALGLTAEEIAALS